MGQTNSLGNGNSSFIIRTRESASLVTLVRFSTDGTNWALALGTTVAIDDGKWHYVSITRNGTTVILYIDGVNVASGTLSGAIYNSTTILGIGRPGEITTLYYNGILDSMRIYKGRALSASEILSNYQAGNIEIQTRSGATSDPNDGTWEAWKPTTGETQLLSMDSDQSNWNAPQQIDGYTKLLLHMDGTDAATTFPNSATTTHTVTAVNQAQVDTAQSKFSGASGLFDGTGDYLSVPASTDFVFGTGDFTIDAWIYQTSWPPGYSSIFTNIASWSGTALNFRIMPTGDIRFSTGLGDILASSNTVSLAKWTHIAVVRSSGTLQLFINGVSGGQVANSTNFSESNIVYIGALPLSGGGEMIGGIDELRISKGVARWTSNFTPPPRPYGSNVKMDNDGIIKMEGASSTKLTLGAPQIDGNTVALWHFEETGTTTGTYLYDETANNNDATTTGTTVADGILARRGSLMGRVIM